MIFFSIVAVIDCGFGVICDYLNSHSKGGDTKDRYYIAKQTSEDLLMMGSSRMHHHYVTEIVEDSLHMSAYNCGVDGNGILRMNALGEGGAYGACLLLELGECETGGLVCNGELLRARFGGRFQPFQHVLHGLS